MKMKICIAVSLMALGAIVSDVIRTGKGLEVVSVSKSTMKLTQKRAQIDCVASLNQHTLSMAYKTPTVVYSCMSPISALTYPRGDSWHDSYLDDCAPTEYFLRAGNVPAVTVVHKVYTRPPFLGIIVRKAPELVMAMSCSFPHGTHMEKDCTECISQISVSCSTCYPSLWAREP